MTSFLTIQELTNMKFKCFGHNVLISKHATFYNNHNISIGSNVRIDDFCLISGGSYINIGNYIHISSHCGIWGNCGVTIHDFTNISSGSKVYSETDDFSGNSLVGPMVPKRFRIKLYGGPVILHKHTLIGANSVILPNITLHDGVAIGANSLVNISCDEWHIYAGSPIRKLHPRNKNILTLESQLNSKKLLTLNNILKSSMSHDKAKLLKSKLTGTTFHLHYHILDDIINSIDTKINYLEIGVFNGGSLLFVAQNMKVKNVVGIDPLNLHNQKKLLQSNIDNLNVHGTNVAIIEDYSTSENAISQVTQFCDKFGLFDVLFIDGDHKYQSVISDFDMYHKFMKSGGFIIFDDYMDKTYSPEVKGAVDDIVDNIGKYDKVFDIIGQVNNYTQEVIENSSLNNEFILQIYNKYDLNYYIQSNVNMKHIPIIKSDVEFIIVIATYYRPNGSTCEYMKRCLKSIQDQKYENWIIYIVGDDYEKVEELELFRSMIIGKIEIFNHDDPERKYIKDKLKLWKIAGATAINYGLRIARERGYKYYVHIDDDDFWEPEHLLLMTYVYNMYPQCAFVNTLSTYPNGAILPVGVGIIVRPNNFLPRLGNVIHSSVSFRIDLINFEYYTTKDEGQIHEPTDGVMWNNISHSLQLNQYFCSICVPFLTTHHDEEGLARK